MQKVRKNLETYPETTTGKWSPLPLGKYYPNFLEYTEIGKYKCIRETGRYIKKKIGDRTIRIKRFFFLF